MQAYTYDELGDLKAQILAICERVAADNPTAWREAHNGRWDDDSARYNDLCVQALRAAGIAAGRNGKRGGTSMSDDVLAFGLQAGQGGAADYSGRFPEMAIIDYIIGAGDPDLRKRSVGWIDQSKEAPGRYMDPQGLPRVDGGGEPVPTPTPPTPSPQPPPTPPSTDLSAVKAQLASLLDQQQILVQGQAAQDAALTSIKAALDNVSVFVDHMVNDGPAGDQSRAPNHITDIKERLDAIAAQVAAKGDGRCRLRF